MRETIERIWSQIREWFAAMPRGRKIQLTVLTFAVIILAITAVSLLTRTNWVTLTGTGDETNTSHIYIALNEMNIPNRVDSAGRIQVPEERLGEVRMRLQDQGLMGTSAFSLDILGEATGFGITDAHSKQLYERQRADEIRTQLLQNPSITNALVIVNMGETSPFRIQTNTRQASANVMLTIRNSGRLTTTEAQSVAELVRTAVPGIEYENISIVDDSLYTYRIGDNSMDIEEVSDKRIALQNRLSEQFKVQIEQLISPIFGISNLQVQPNVRLNFDRRVTEQVEFFPPVPGELDGIIRSSEIINEFSRRWSEAEGIPGTDSNAMGTAEYPWGTLDDMDMYRRNVMGTNYEINQTVTQIEHEMGVIEYLSIAVIVNSEIEGIDQDYTIELTDSISKALGVAPANVSVQSLPFSFIDTRAADMMAMWAEEEAARRNREIFETILMYVVILLLGVMVMLLVRSIVRAVKPPPEPEPVLAAIGADGIDFIVDDDEFEDAATEYEDVELHTKSPGLEQIERFIDKDSASVAQLLRNWLSDD